MANTHTDNRQLTLEQLREQLAIAKGKAKHKLQLELAHRIRRNA